MSAPLPSDGQALFDDFSDKLAAANASDQAKAQSAAALAQAQTTDETNATAQLDAHKASTSSGNAFVEWFKHYAGL